MVEQAELQPCGSALGVGQARRYRNGLRLLRRFVLPNGAIRSPDVSWVENSRLEALSTEEREKYLPLCPDFVIELRSPTDGLRALQEKMAEYLENETKLGWLLDPGRKRVYVYRPGEPVQELKDPRTISGEPVLPGFVLDLGEVW